MQVATPRTATVAPHHHRRRNAPPRFPPTTAVAAGLALALASACRPAESHDVTIRSDSAGVEIVTSDPSRSDATCTLGDEPIFRVGNNESDEAQWFSTIRGMGRLSDGSVAVIDDTSAEIRIFDVAGRHVRSMGRHGEGPGEFRSAWKLWVLPGDTLWAGDYRPWRYNVFTSDGEWVRAVQMNPIYGNLSRGGGVLDNGVSVNSVWRRPTPRDFKTPDTVVVEAHGLDGERLETLGRILHTTYGPDGMYQIFTQSAVVEAAGSTIATGADERNGGTPAGRRVPAASHPAVARFRPGRHRRRCTGVARRPHRESRGPRLSRLEFHRQSGCE